MSMIPSPTVTIAVQSVIARRPPLTELRLDVTLTNPSAVARWYLVPRDVNSPIGQRGVDVLELFRWTGGGGGDRAVVGSFQGTGGFFAVHVAPRAGLRVQGLPVEWFRGDDDAARPTLTVVVAQSVTIGGKPAAAWYPDGDPLVEGSRAVERSEITGSVRFEPDSAEVPVRLDGVERTSIVLSWK